MQTSVNLQELFEYSIIPIILIIVIIAILTCYVVYTKVSKNENINNKRISNKTIKAMPQKNIHKIKERYLAQLNSIEYEYKKDSIELRKAYQLISETIRIFVFEVTDIKTQNYTLSELEKTNIPELYEAIKEYYEPEFASKSNGDFNSSINKARRIIKEWN